MVLSANKKKENLKIISRKIYIWITFVKKLKEDMRKNQEKLMRNCNSI
mgnify:CR=1 FL=1|jgi:hypothetical protein